MPRIKLDKIDRKILNDLQKNGRITNVELAKRAGISAPPCLRRVRALEEAGLIEGYHARLKASSLGYNLTVFAKVLLESHAEDDLKEFEAWLDAQPMVRESWMISGETDFLLKITAKDWEDYQSFHTNGLTKAPNVVSVKSYLTIRSTKQEPGVPINVD